MKKIYLQGLVIIVLLVLTSVAQAQYMPVVFDKEYGTNDRILEVIPSANGDIIMVGQDNKSLHISRLDRNGDVIFSRVLAGFTEVNSVKQLGNDRLLIIGQSNVQKKRGKQPEEVTLSGRVLIVNADGQPDADLYIGRQGSSLLTGSLLVNGDLLVGGYDISGDAEGGKRGMVVKMNVQGGVIYTYYSVQGEACTHLEILGHETEYLCAGFSSAVGNAQASIVRLDQNGKPYYNTLLPSSGFRITAMKSNVVDGSMILIGNSAAEGGLIYKIRPEGDIVFTKTIVPASDKTSLERLFVARNGNILVGGSGARGHYAMLRPDGTSLVQGVIPGSVRGVGMNEATGESVVTSYDPALRRGTFNRISGAGKAEFERVIDGDFDGVYISNNSEVWLLSTKEGRVCLYSALGDKLSDRYVLDNRATNFESALKSPYGEMLFVGQGNRLVKLSHGLYVSDVKITKPVDGVATALFTVTLTGYATTKEGAPVPVRVGFATREGSAGTQYHFTPVEGQLSFSPSNAEAARYLVKQEVEVPVKANDFVEGIKEFELTLANVHNSYIIKDSGKGIIEDQQSHVKLIATQEGLEGLKDVVYEIGLFKTNGSPLTNATGSNIIVDGSYGEGTSDALDYEMGLTPRVIIPNSQHSSTFAARTLSDFRYEIPKSIIINFDKVHTLSGSNVGFEGALLSCVGTVSDQPAVVRLEALGDQRVNNMVSGFFNISLRRASDGALLTNATGSDITVTCKVLDEGSAKEGKDFVLTNAHDLRIIGDGNHSAVNVSGIVLHNTGRTGSARVEMAVEGVATPADAPKLTIDPTGKTAGFNINN